MANSPSTFSSIINLVLNLCPRFSSKQSNPSENQVQSIIKASHTEAPNNNVNKGINISTDTITNVDISDLEDMSPDAVHHEMHDNPFLHENMFQDSVRNEMLTHYNRIVIGSIKEFFQSINTNNLTEVLQALWELHFMLAIRAPELASHYNMAFKLHQIIAEEVPNLVRAHLHCNTAYNAEHNVRGRPHPRGNQYHWYS